MLATDQSRRMIGDAWAFYDAAIALLERGDLRRAAGKAWQASEQAANALILERTGREPQNERETTQELLYLRGQSEAFAAFDDRFVGQIHDLYGDCYIDNHCEPEDVHAKMIRETADFIRDAERLAGDGAGG